MANLIPPEAERIVRNEYRARVLTVWLVLLAASVAVVVLLLVPVYVLIESQTRAYAGAYVEAEGQSDQFSSIGTSITESNTVASVLVAHERSVPISLYLSAVTGAVGSGIELARFEYENDELPISIGGTANSRSELAAFKAALEVTGHFERVELPISSLASERDIEFTMQLERKKEPQE